MRIFLLLVLAALARAFLWPWEDDLSPSSLLLAPATSSTTHSSAFSSSASDDSSSSDSSASTTDDASASSTADASASTAGSSTETFGGDGKEYVPQETLCPENSVLREATALSDQEKAYIANRQQVTNENLSDFLSSVANLTDFDADKFISGASKNITIGLAFSGGGYRAMLCGAGEVLALDNRFLELTTSGLGGLLQSASYITGLSGGSWLVGTLVLNDWISVGDILSTDTIWDLEDLIFNPSGINLIETVSYYNELREAVSAKDDAGFDTSITDVWGRALSYQFFDVQTTYNGGENVTWLSVRNQAAFQNYLMPFPIVVADGRSPGTLIINENSTVFEFTPYELGSWDPSLNTFIELEYLGTSLDNGTPNGSCVSNFDNAGFILGTSLSLFNQALLRVELSSSLNWAVKKVLEMILEPFSTLETDIAVYEPNPFYNSEYADLESITSNATLHLVDGGEDLQNVPLYPLIQTARGVDIIFAYDNSADTDLNWPNGTSLVHTYGRQFSSQGKGTPFPYVPSVETFVSEGYDQRPVFFGCSAANLSALVDYHGGDLNTTDVPLVVYIPNSYHLYEANISTYQMSYDDDERDSVVQNGFEVLTRGNFTQDSAWATCVGCAIIRREQERMGEEQLDECKQCFADYCWDGDYGESATLTVDLSSLSLSAALTLLSLKAGSSSATATAASTTSLTSKRSGAGRVVPGWLMVLALL